jgi:hypothetical protein
MSDESGEFLFPFGGGRVRYGGGKIHYSPVHPTVAADDDSITPIEVSEDGDNPALSPRLDLESDSDEDRDIPVALPADHRSPLSDGSSDDRSTVDDGTNSFDMDRPVINWSPFLGHDFADMVEDGIDLVGIVMARPASKRQPLSVSSSGNSRDSDEANPIQMARPAARRMVLSVCSSPEDPIATDSRSGEIPMARPVSRRWALSIDTDDEAGSPMAQPASQPTQATRKRTRSSCSDESNSCAILQADTSQDVIKVRRGPRRVPAIVEATTRHSMTAELCNASDSEPETAGEAKPHMWLTGLAVPRIDSAYRHSEHAGEAFVESPQDMDFHHGLETPEFNDSRGLQAPDLDSLDDVPMVEDPGWLDHFQDGSDLRFASENEACLARFAHLWEDPGAEPVDQGLFADFDGDFTGTAHSPGNVLDGAAVDTTPSSSSPASGRVSSLPTVESLRAAYFRKNEEEPESGEARLQRGTNFEAFYKLRTGRSF